jgi:3-ketosteroid 9alpha-monooxygenase subunit A
MAWEEGMLTYPRGWFVICWADELPVGGVKPMTYFGQHLVAFRGEDGQVRVLEGHCAHMGASLGNGGRVVGNHIECPFHAWKFCGTGECVEIPYTKKIPVRARQKAFRVQEKNGAIYMWHDELGRDPDFDVPAIEGYGTDEWLPWATKYYRVKTHPREIVDNLADRAHFARVHNTDIEQFDFKVDGITAVQYTKGAAKMASGGVDPFSSTTTYHGPGYLIMKMDGLLSNYMMAAHTPINENELDLRLSVTLKVVGNRAKTEGYVGMYLDNLKAGFEDDLHIWENKIYRDPPLICEGDGPIGHLRRWYKQFYARPTEAAGREAK